MDRFDLLAAIERFLSTRKMSPSTFGRKAVNDGKFVSRLRSGGRCWPETAERALRYIRDAERSEMETAKAA